MARRGADEEPSYRARAERLFLVATILLLGYLAYLLFQPFLEWVILGFLFAYLFHRPYRASLRIFRRPGIASGVWLTIILLIFFVPFVVLIALLSRDVASFADRFKDFDLEAFVLTILSSMSSNFGVGADSDTLNSAARTISEQVNQRAGEFLAAFASDLLEGIGRVLLGFFIFGFTVFYGFIDGPRFTRGIMSVIPLHRAEKQLLLHELRTVTNAVFVGHVLISLIQAAVGTIGFLVLGVPRAFLWGFVMLLASIIPVVGPFIVWVPVGLFLLASDAPVDGLFSSDPTFAALGVLLVVGPLTSTVDNIVRPKLVGSRADIHPFLVLVGAVGGILVFGVMGFVVGPLILSLLIAVLRVYRAHWRGEEVHGAATAAEARARMGSLVPREPDVMKPVPRRKRRAK